MSFMDEHSKKRQEQYRAAHDAAYGEKSSRADALIGFSYLLTCPMGEIAKQNLMADALAMLCKTIGEELKIGGAA